MMRGVQGESVAARIRKRRQVLGMRQRDLAALLDVSPSTVANWETGKHLPRRYLGKVEQVLGISLEDEAEQQLPQIVRDNYDDDAVRAVWAQKRISADARLGMITWYVSQRDMGTGQAGSAGL